MNKTAILTMMSLILMGIAWNLLLHGLYPAGMLFVPALLLLLPIAFEGF